MKLGRVAWLIILVSATACGSRTGPNAGMVGPEPPAAMGGQAPLGPGPGKPKPSPENPPVAKPEPKPQPEPEPEPEPEPVDPCVPTCEGRVCGADDDCGGTCENACPKSVTLFGGSDGWGSYVNDTWVFDGRAWSEQTVSSPAPRSAGGMAWLDDKNVLFGGVGELAEQSPAEGLGDTHEWDGAAWTERSAAGPSARWSHEMATLNGKVVLFGGYNTNEQYLGETWEWDGEAWTERQVPSPPGRVAHAMATVGNQIVLFGGQGEQGWLGDTWVWDGDAWTELMVSPSPSARAGHSMAGGATKAVLFGGANLDDTWEWDGAAWSQHAVSGPPARSSAGMAAWGQKILLFGGLRVVGTTYEYFADTWAYDGSGWSELPISGPIGVASPFMAER